MLGLVLCVFGVVTLPLCLWAWLGNCRLAISAAPNRWSRTWRWSWAVGIALAISAIFLWYPVEGGEDRYRVFGVPFRAYAYDQHGLDYVSCLTLPALVLNFVFWCFVPQLGFRIWARYALRSQVPQYNDLDTTGHSLSDP